MTSQDTPAGTEAATRIADLLLLFVEGGESLGVTYISRELGLSKSVVHRMLQALVSRGLLQQSAQTRAYSLGPAAAAFGARALRDSSLRSLGRPLLERLQSVTGETATISGLLPGGRVYLDQVESEREIKMTVEVGRKFPLHAGSSGLCILAFLPADKAEAVLNARLAQITSQTVTSRDDIRDLLAQTRRDGYYQSFGQRQEGSGSIAAPVFGIDGVVGAVSICGPEARLRKVDLELFVATLKPIADELSRSLGWLGGLPETPQPLPFHEIA